MHLIIDATRALWVCVMPLRCKNKILDKLRVSVKQSDAFYNVPVVELKGLIPDFELLAFEWGAPGQFVVNDTC